MLGSSELKICVNLSVFLSLDSLIAASPSCLGFAFSLVDYCILIR